MRTIWPEVLQAMGGTAGGLGLLWLLHQALHVPLPRYFGWIVVAALLVSGLVTAAVGWGQERRPLSPATRRTLAYGAGTGLIFLIVGGFALWLCVNPNIAPLAAVLGSGGALLGGGLAVWALLRWRGHRGGKDGQLERRP